MARIDDVEQELKATPRTVLVTGGAGFIGSNLVERLLELGQTVRVLDDFSTGHRKNLVPHPRLTVIEGDIRDLTVCRRACEGAQLVLHEAALGSVPRSLKDPLTTHQVNVDGTVHMMLAARDAKVERFVYASSSSVYGDDPRLPKVEGQEGRPLSPYAVTKKVNEQYARVFFDVYGFPVVGLRYFNVFGRRQDPNGPYAAVIPRWTAQLLNGQPCVIYGDGETSRDFCYVDNVVQANLLAATCEPQALGQVFNVAFCARMTLKDLYGQIRKALARQKPEVASAEVRFEPARDGDIRHSHADIARAASLLGYAPKVSAAAGLEQTMPWYVAQARER